MGRFLDKNRIQNLVIFDKNHPGRFLGKSQISDKIRRNHRFRLENQRHKSVFTGKSGDIPEKLVYGADFLDKN